MDKLEFDIPVEELKLDFLELKLEPLEVTLEPIEVNLQDLDKLDLPYFKEVQQW